MTYSVRMTMQQAAAATGGELLGNGREAFVGLTIDSRQVQPGNAFVAIVGERFDGHRFCSQAAADGAALLVVSAPPDPRPPHTAVLVCEDTRLALGARARAWRLEVDPRVIAITGSLGKTTTKELVRNIMTAAGETHCTPGNFNNDIGLPLTLLSMDPATRYLVTEMGMNGPGEIAALAALARPDVGLITCVAPVHLEGLGSIEAIAAAKAELLVAMDGRGTAVVPDDEPLLDPWTEGIPADRCLRFGRGAGSDVTLLERRSRGLDGSRILLSMGGREHAVDLPLVGAHNAINAAAAAAAAIAAGVDPEIIADALARPPALKHRSVVRHLAPWTVLDDCYNASPVSMMAGLDTLVDLAAGGPAVAVLGDMLELGPDSPRLHREVGAHAAGLELSLLVTVGELGEQIARGARDAGMAPGVVAALPTADAAVAHVRERAADGGHVLVKASRGARLEEVIDGLSQAADAGEGATDGE